MRTLIRLHELNPDERAVVYELKNECGMRRRLQDLGLIEGTVVECIGKAPSGGLCAYLIRGAVIAIRASDGQHVTVTPIGEKEP